MHERDDQRGCKRSEQYCTYAEQHPDRRAAVGDGSDRDHFAGIQSLDVDAQEYPLSC